MKAQQTECFRENGVLEGLFLKHHIFLLKYESVIQRMQKVMDEITVT